MQVPTSWLSLDKIPVGDARAEQCCEVIEAAETMAVYLGERCEGLVEVLGALWRQTERAQHLRMSEMVLPDDLRIRCALKWLYQVNRVIGKVLIMTAGEVSAMQRAGIALLKLHVGEREASACGSSDAQANSRFGGA